MNIARNCHVILLSQLVFDFKKSYLQRSLKILKQFLSTLFTKIGFKKLQAVSRTWILFQKRESLPNWWLLDQAWKVTLQDGFSKDFVKLQHSWSSSWVPLATTLEQTIFTSSSNIAHSPVQKHSRFVQRRTERWDLSYFNKIGSLYLTLAVLHRPGWPQKDRNLPDSATRILGLKHVLLYQTSTIGFKIGDLWITTAPTIK